MSPAPFDHERDDSPLVPATVINRFMQTYLVMGGLGLLACTFWHENLATLFRLPTTMGRTSYLVVLAALAVILIATVGELCKQLFPSYAAQRQALAQAMGPLSASQIALLALTAALAEELLFRGALQPLLGVAATSILLAMLHFRTSDGIANPFMLMTLVLSLTLGCLNHYSSSLYPGLIVHLILNGAFLWRHAFAGRRSAHGQGDPLAKTAQESEPPL